MVLARRTPKVRWELWNTKSEVSSAHKLFYRFTEQLFLRMVGGAFSRF